VFGGLVVVAAAMVPRHPERAEFLGVLATFTLLLFGLVYIFESGVTYYVSWSFVFIPIAFALQGVRRAVVWIVLLIALAGLFLLLHPGPVPLEPVMLREWAVSYLVVFGIALVFQFVREYYEGLVARLNQRLEQLATTDQLTEAYNRRMMESLLGRELERNAAAVDAGFSVILFDLDHFKRVNDEHGHLVGDAVLRRVADIARERVRPSDFFGRWGGEEFLVLSAGTTLRTAAEIAERLRAAIAEHEFEHGDRVTASFGVSSLLPGDDLDSLIRRADDALYEAKAKDRNCVALAPEPAAAVAPGGDEARSGDAAHG
jgi:diguanylate cyclase (GGDEF)-like protein